MKRPTFEISEIKGLSSTERLEALNRVSIQTKDHLIKWLIATDRAWLIFNAKDLVDSLPFPEGVEDFMRTVNAYAQYRNSTKTGQTFEVIDPITDEKILAPKLVGELLEKDELDRAIRYLVGLITEINPKWRLESTPL